MNTIMRMPYILMACVLFSCSGDQHEVTPTASTNQGQLLFLRGDHVKAIEVLKREVADPASGVVPHRFLGRAFLSIGQYEAALGAPYSNRNTPFLCTLCTEAMDSSIDPTWLPVVRYSK